MHDIANLVETHGDEEMHLHKDVSVAIIIDSKEDKVLVSNDPFKIFTLMIKPLMIWIW